MSGVQVDRPYLLQGLRVVALEHAVAGPLCTRHLADLGADVVKIERPGTGDFARLYDSILSGTSTYFAWLNRGKRSLAVDLKEPAGRAILDDLLARADVVVANLGPGAFERLVDEDSLEQANQALIRCVISGYGTAGPYHGRKAFDLLVQGEAGITLSTGTSEAPAKVGVSLADLAAGTYAFGLVNAALSHRVTTGTGCRLDVSMFHIMAEWMSPLLIAQRHGFPPPPPAGMRHATIAPYGPYETADGHWLNIAAQNEGQWLRLSRDVLGSEELAADPDLVSNAQRVAHRDRLERLVAELVGKFAREELLRRLDAADVPWGQLNDLSDVVDHPQLKDRWSTHAASGVKAAGLIDPFMIDGVDGVLRDAPTLGQHTDEVLRELGREPREIEDHYAKGVVA